MASETEICNMALSHLGVGKEIANLDTEASQEASACRRFYDLARDATLRGFNWPFANVTTTLALVETDPNDEWAYSYRYPSDCLKLIKLLSGTRNDTRASRVPYKIAQDNSGKIILTDIEDAQVEYLLLEDDPSMYPSDFLIALSYRLAAFIAPRVTGGDPFKLGDRAMQMFDLEMSTARATAINEQQEEVEPDSPYLAARE